MDKKLTHGVFRRVKRGQVRDLLAGKIHQSFTVAADQLYQRGYMTEDERIALSGAIGDVLPEFQEAIDENVGNRTVDTNDLRAIAEMSLVKRTHSRTKCMECDSKPTIACHWADGRGMAWFCKSHFKSWLEEDDREICGVWVLEEGECPEDISKTPKGTNKIRKLGEDVSQKEIYSRIDELTKRGGAGSGHHGHRGRGGQTGGSLPRAKGTHLGGLGVPDMKDASKRTFVSQRIMQVDDETVVALVSLRRMDVFKTKPYRMESRWYVKDRKGPATEDQQSAGAELLSDLEISTAQIMEISGWERSTYRDNLWVAPWGSVLHIPSELTTRHHAEIHPGTGTDQSVHSGGKGGPTGGVARPRHAPGVTPVSGGAKKQGVSQADKVSRGLDQSGIEIKKQWTSDNGERMTLQGGAANDTESFADEISKATGMDIMDFAIQDNLDGTWDITLIDGGEEEAVEGVGGHTEEMHEEELELTSAQAYLDKPTQRSDDGIFGVAYTEESWTDLASEVMENQPPEVQERMAEIEQKIREGTQSIEEHRDAETGEWTPERRALHERIIQRAMTYAGEAPERAEGESPQLWVTGGLPGSGKTSVLRQREAFPEGTVEIDSDYIKTQLPEYEGWNATLLHEESSAIVQELFRRSTSEGRDIAYDATLKTTEKAEELMSGLQNMNYDVNVIYVDVPMAMSMERAINRFATQGGRYVSPMYIASHDSKNVKTLAEIRDSVTSWEHWDNSQPAGQPPTLLATGGRQAGETSYEPSLQPVEPVTSGEVYQSGSDYEPSLQDVEPIAAEQIYEGETDAL